MDIEVRNLTLKYGDAVAIDDLDLTVANGEALVLLGQSGCGKTSTMRCIAGLETPSAGTIKIDGKTVFDSRQGISIPAHKRNIGMVFQSYAIWPHLTVFENVAFPLTMERVKKDEIKRRVGEMLDLVGLSSFAERGASLLSGGQMQRVALARSLVMQPSVLLLDEPLSNLDARLRERLRVELRELQVRLGVTSIYVTHDQEEALALADRVALMQQGRIVQIGAPSEIYSSPMSASIADFLGVGNILDVHSVEGSSASVSGLGVVTTAAPSAPQKNLKLCVRAEDIELTAPDQKGVNVFPGRLAVVSFQGATVRYRIEMESGAVIQALGSKSTVAEHRTGDPVGVRIAPQAAQVLPAEVER